MSSNFNTESSPRRDSTLIKLLKLAYESTFERLVTGSNPSNFIISVTSLLSATSECFLSSNQPVPTAGSCSSDSCLPLYLLFSESLGGEATTCGTSGAVFTLRGDFAFSKGSISSSSSGGSNRFCSSTSIVYMVYKVGIFLLESVF